MSGYDKDGHEVPLLLRDDYFASMDGLQDIQEDDNGE